MISAQLRRTVRILYAFACGYCGVTEDEVGSQLTVDHYHPKDAGGTDAIDNLVYACFMCNLHKSAAWNPQTPPVLHPLQTDMTLHIRALDNGRLEALTVEGTRHIGILHLNRQPMIERRKRNRLIERLIERDTRIDEQEQQIERAAWERKKLLRRRGRRKRR